jgi:hypothetical protein
MGKGNNLILALIAFGIANYHEACSFAVPLASPKNDF